MTEPSGLPPEPEVHEVWPEDPTDIPYDHARENLWEWIEAANGWKIIDAPEPTTGGGQQ